MKDNAILLVAIVRVEPTDSANKDRIVSKSPTQAYNEGWDRMFGKKRETSAHLN